MRQFPVIIENDETGGYVVDCPLFEGCFTQGETLDDALKNIKEVIGMCLEEQQTDIFVPQQVGIHMVAV